MNDLIERLHRSKLTFVASRDSTGGVEVDGYAEFENR